MKRANEIVKEYLERNGGELCTAYAEITRNIHEYKEVDEKLTSLLCAKTKLEKCMVAKVMQADGWRQFPSDVWCRM